MHATHTYMYTHTHTHTHTHTLLYIILYHCPHTRLSPQGKGGKFCHLKPMPQPDNYVCFMSVENPGQYIAFMGNGAPGVPRNMRETNQETQFFIRVEVRKLMTYVHVGSCMEHGSIHVAEKILQPCFSP